MKIMKFGKLTYVRKTFLKKYAENEAGRLVVDLFFLKKKSYEVKAGGMQLSTWHTIKTKSVKL